MPPLPRATIERQLEAAYVALETLGRERAKLTAENEALRSELSEYRGALDGLLGKIAETSRQTEQG